MENVSWLGVIGILLVALNILNLYNTAHTARKNAREPYVSLEKRVKEVESKVEEHKYEMENIKRDVDEAHKKIRDNEADTKAQNKALLAILIWIKSNSKPGDDMSQIDGAISAINS